ncbi:non-specific serine,threonine protein kinase [Sarracenia purpurea var. burkii]
MVIAFTYKGSPVLHLSVPSVDRFAFVVISRPLDFIALFDGFMGLAEFEHPTDMQDSFIVVEFDTGFDLSLGDINDNYVGVDVNFVMSLASIDFTKGIDLKSGKQMTRVF